MKRYAKTLTALLLTLAMLFSACGQTDDTPVSDVATNEPLHLTVRIGQPQTTPDPASATADGSDTILYHLYENLMRWEDDGTG